mmetsp:Transcript_10243/g.11883  ORF Transcript_10243/g.11883 Transcript_10243/m.11883 type:complete len:214 (+) Transcript_10243:211-852(+)
MTSGTTNASGEDLSGMVEMAQTANKANQVVNNITAQIPQETKDFMRTAKEKVLDSDKLRSFTAFFGFGETNSFSFPFSPSVVCGRLKDNILFFYLNYILLTAVVFTLTLVTVLLTPQTLITIVALAIGWLLMIRKTADGPIDVKCLSISRKEGSAFMMVVSGIVLFFLLKSIFWVSLGSASFLALVHAWTRDASTHISEDTAAGSLNPGEEFA